jgi:hypothetical protein
VPVKQERTAGQNVFNHVILVNVRRVVTSHEVSLGDEICRFNRGFTEAQVRNRNAARFFGVISEVRLNLHVGVLADDFGAVFVRADRTVAADTPELTARGAFGHGVRVLVNRER